MPLRQVFLFVPPSVRNFNITWFAGRTCFAGTG